MEPITRQFLDYLTERAYRLVQNDPLCSPAIGTLFRTDTIIREVIDTMQFEVSQPFLKIINSSCPPSADNFKETIQELGYSRDHWAIYVIIMEK